MRATIVIDTSSNSGLLAMVREQEVLCEFRFPTGRASDPAIFQSELADLLKRNENPGRVVVGLGPGNHSSVRVGIASAIGLSIALNIPVHGVPSPLGYETDMDTFTAIGRAGRDEVWSMKVQNSIATDGACILKEDALDDAGVHSRLTLDASLREKAVLRELSAIRLSQLPLDQESAKSLAPIYLRPANISSAKALPKVQWQNLPDQR